MGRLFTVLYFSERSQMSIVESNMPPSWCLDASETGERVQNARGQGWWRARHPGTPTLLTPSPLPTGILCSPQFCSHQETMQDGGLSDSTIDIYDLTGKQGTVSSLEYGLSLCDMQISYEMVSNAHVHQLAVSLNNLVPRARLSFGQHQETELWNNQFSEFPVSLFRSSGFTAPAYLRTLLDVQR